MTTPGNCSRGNKASGAKADPKQNIKTDGHSSGTLPAPAFAMKLSLLLVVSTAGLWVAASANSVDSKQSKTDVCPHPFVDINGRCLFINNFAQMTWEAARGFCQGFQADLVAVDEANFLANIVDFIYNEQGADGMGFLQLAPAWASLVALSLQGSPLLGCTTDFGAQDVTGGSQRIPRDRDSDSPTTRDALVPWQPERAARTGDSEGPPPMPLPGGGSRPDMVRVYSFQASGEASVNSSLQYKKGLPEMSAVTLCLWVRFRHFGAAYDTLVSYFTVGDDDMKLSHEWKNKEIVFWVRAYRVTVKTTVPLYTWMHLVVGINFITGSHYFLINNKKAASVIATVDASQVGQPVAGGGTLVLGQDQDSPGGGFSMTQSFSGDLVGFCLFLTVIDMTLSGFSCSGSDFGSDEPEVSLNVLDDWEMIGDVSSSLVSNSIVHPDQKILFYVLPERRIYEEAARLCEVLGLPLAVPKSEAENENLFVLSLAVEDSCISDYSTNVWIGANANLTASAWQDGNSGETLSYDNFDAKYSFISPARQCVSMGSSFYPKIWYNTGCSQYNPCPACENAPVNSIQVRGLCLQSHFDRRLHIHGTKNLKPMFHGTFYTRLWWDNSTWVMASRLLPRLEARMVIDHTEAYPIGLHRWHVSGDECPAEQLDLLLTVCGEDSFPCSDGTCVLMSQRCDLRAHCDDGSDETECDIVYLETNYERTLPPPPPEKEDVLNVTLSIAITAVRTLNLLDQTVTLDVRLTSEWQDSRLKYNDLHSEQFRNQLQDHERLWLPRLITTDDTGSRVDVVTRGESLVVLRGSEALPADDARARKAVVYSGSGNPLLLRQEMSVSFQCQFDLRWFPFDHQRCSLNFRLSEVESKLVRVIALEPQYLGPEKLPEYQVRAVTMQSRGANGDSGQQLTVRFTNLYRYYLANSYLPSFLLVVISYSTFYFRLEDFNERIMVSITAMLVLVALFSQTSSTILKTTYLKLIDIWYMVCIVVDFVMVMMLALIDFVLHNRSSNRIMVMPSSKNSRSRYFPSNAEKLNKIGRVALPLLFLAFLLVYAVVACVKMK